MPSIMNIGNISHYSPIFAAQRRAMPQLPVTPVTPVRPVAPVAAGVSRQAGIFAPLMSTAYPAEQAARSRVSYSPQAAVRQDTPLSQDYAWRFAGMDWGALAQDPKELAARMRVQYPGDREASAQDPEGVEIQGSLGAEGAQQAAEEGRCQTCEERKYQDGSDDISVSYQSPTNIDPDVAPAAVRGHELEHVYHEQAKAQREGRKVVSQTVTLHTDICPECGRTYVSGGTTRTVTKAVNREPQELGQGKEEP